MKIHHISARVILMAALSTPAFAQEIPTPAPASVGAFEASGARIGMNAELALKSIAATKPEWAGQIQGQAVGAAHDCAGQGRASVILAFAAGQPSAALDLRCAQAPQNPAVSSIHIKSRVGPGLAASDVLAALSGRYGPATSSSPLMGGGFELSWRAAAPANPAAAQGEALIARLEANPLDGSPTTLILSISSGAPAKSAIAAPTGLPF